MTSHFGFRNLLAWVNQYRLGFFRSRMATALIHEETWREPLIEAVLPQPGERILIIGPNCASLAVALAKRFQTTHFAAADCTQASIDSAQRTSTGLDLVLQFTALDQPLPFAAATFDKVLSALALHELPPQDKLSLLKEARRMLRRDGTLYAAEYDKPTVPSETAVFKTRDVSCAEATQPHMDGSWITLFGRAGFKNVRTLSNYSVRFGRVALVKARKL